MCLTMAVGYPIKTGLVIYWPKCQTFSHNLAAPEWLAHVVEQVNKSNISTTDLIWSIQSLALIHDSFIAEFIVLMYSLD